jgi:hypothetical protein
LATFNIAKKKSILTLSLYAFRACACAKLFADEGNVLMAQVESWKNKNIDGFYTKMTQKGGFSKLCEKFF